MKTSSIFSVVAMLTGVSGSALAIGPQSIEAAAPQIKIAMYSDGRNTYVQSVPGLIIHGATADGDKLIVPGVQREVHGFIGGKSITITQQPPAPPAASVIVPSPAALSDRLKRLEDELQRKEKALKAVTQTKTAAASDMPAPKPAAPVPAATWEVLANDVRLANTFERWAKTAGYRVQWDAAQHVLISATTAFSGSFEDAVRNVLSTPGIRLSAYPLEACVYENTPPLIRITRQGEQAKECPDL